MSAAVVAQPDFFDRLGERTADRVNPIVVKEVRQGLRTRVFWVFFSLMLVANLFISLGFFAASENGDANGRPAFIAFFVCLGVVQFFVIPYSAYRSMARETEEETWVLLTLTGLGPRRILLGKVGSFVLQGALYASASAPFLLFSYYLNGIDLPTILLAVVGSVAYQVFLVAVGVSIATLADTRIVRSLLHFVLLGTLLMALVYGIGAAVALTEFSSRGFGSSGFRTAASSFVFGFLTTGVILFELAAARLSLMTEDYARGPRLAYLVQFFGALGLFIWGSLAASEPRVLTAGCIVLSAYALGVGVMAMTDRDGMVKAHWLRAGRWSLFKPGALRAFAMVVGSLLLASGILLALAWTKANQDNLALIAAAPAFALTYLAASNVIARWIPHTQGQAPALVRLVFIAIMVLGTGLPPLIGELVTEADDERFNLLNPVLGLANIGKAGLGGWPMVAIIWAVAFGLVALAFSMLRQRDVEL